MAAALTAPISSVAKLSHRPQRQAVLLPASRAASRAALARPILLPAQKAIRRDLICRATAVVEENGATPAGIESIPKPVIKIDNQHDPFATIVSIEYGDRLGELGDTAAALKNLGLNIRRAKIRGTPGGGQKNKFYLTDARTSEKIIKSAQLEEIRLTILNTMLKFHPESGEELAWGVKAKKPSKRELTSPLGPRNRRVVETIIDVSEHESGSHSELYIETTDRPGLLVEIVGVLKDISVNVVSAEVDTEGIRAKDTFYVTYHGDPLNASMEELVKNALQYYLSLGEVEKEESY